MQITRSQNQIDPYQDNVVSLFHWNNSTTTYITGAGAVHTNGAKYRKRCAIRWKETLGTR